MAIPVSNNKGGNNNMSTPLKVAVAFTFSLSLIIKAVDYYLFFQLYNASCNVSQKNLDILYLIKKRFSDCLSLGKPIENTEEYVKKMLLSSPAYNTITSYRKRMQSILLIIFYSLLWIGYLADYYSYTSFILCAVNSVITIYLTDSLMNTEALLKGSVIQITDYLDNTLRIKINGNKKHKDNSDKSAIPVADINNSISDTLIKSPEKAPKKEKPGIEISDNNAVIASIINEYIS